MKKKMLVLISVAFIICVGAVGITYLLNSEKNDSDINIERNYGSSNTTININNGDVTMDDIDEIVPSKDEVIRNLIKEGYVITQYDTVLESEINATRIYAENKGKFLDICYGLTDENAEEAFKQYEDEYQVFYLMALNSNYVYCISDKKTFKNAGFTSLANEGIQYICD